MTKVRNHNNRSGGDHGDRREYSRPAIEFRGKASGRTRADASGARLLQNRLSDAGGGDGGVKAGRADIIVPERPRHPMDEDGNDRMWSEMSRMVVLQHPKQDGHHGGGNRKGGHARTGSSISVEMSGGVSSGGMKGQEPAVKNCGFMTTATSMKLVRICCVLCISLSQTHQLNTILSLAAISRWYQIVSGGICTWSSACVCCGFRIKTNRAV